MSDELAEIRAELVAIKEQRSELCAEMAAIRAQLSELCAELCPKKESTDFMLEFAQVEASGGDMVQFIKQKDRERRDAERKKTRPVQKKHTDRLGNKTLRRAAA